MLLDNIKHKINHKEEVFFLKKNHKNVNDIGARGFFF